MKSLLIAMLVLVPLYVFAQDAKMPAEAKKVIDKYETSVEVARKAFDASVAKARDQALKDLKPIQTTETKKGNLDGAMMVKGKVDELTAEIPKPAAEGDLAKPLPPGTDPRVAMLIGKWKVSAASANWASTWEFKEGGVIERYEKREAPGKYAIEKDKVHISWTDGGGPLFLKLPKQGTSINSLETINGVGLEIKFDKIEENK